MSAPVIGKCWAAELRDLKPGWDSYGARQISEAAIQTVEQFATVPCSDGGIQLEIHRDGFDIEIVIGPDGRFKSVLATNQEAAGSLEITQPSGSAPDPPAA